MLEHRATIQVYGNPFRRNHWPVEQDIFGEFEVKKGRIVPGSYRPNVKHYTLTEDGFFQLGAELEESLLEVLAAIPDPDDEAELHGLPN